MKKIRIYFKDHHYFVKIRFKKVRKFDQLHKAVEFIEFFFISKKGYLSD